MPKLGFFLLVSLLGAGPLASAKMERLPETGISELELMAVSPQMGLQDLQNPDPSQTFHRFPILARRKIDNPKDIQKILQSVNNSLQPLEKNLCIFMPRHALRVVRGDSVSDVLICYECGDVSIYNDRTDKPTET